MILGSSFGYFIDEAENRKMLLEAFRLLQPGGLLLMDLPPETVQHALSQLGAMQPLQARTGAVHGAMWCDFSGNIHLAREDIGRHNALDKLLGAHRRAGLDRQGFVLITSRASFEMVSGRTI